ncbi:nuclear transport factor 2 family protein [uncultured Alsobacter sp.]|uniref:nuclear transport factor 2 family protein n=1 Tax=uncultured Alsobacter sp. TaxID=1748258 RepID=UPI0025CB8956|nr:nuclear transport factor 2 family protein [uncultured Alsobacter sp.]
MPDSIRAFFDAERRGPDALEIAFLDDAVVKDERTRREGLAAIREWWTTARQTYQHTVMPIDMTGSGDAIAVCAVVTGRFPGSPATLTYSFTLRDRKIAELEIG